MAAKRAKKVSESKLVNAFGGTTARSGKVQKGLLKAVYGLSLDDMNKAFLGNKDTVQKIGAMAQEGEDAIFYGQKLEGAIDSIIKGTDTKNRVMAKALTLAGSGAQATRQQRLDVAFNGILYQDAVKTQNAAFSAKKKLEAAKLANTLEYIEADSFVSRHLETVKADDRKNNLYQKVENMQKDEDRLYRREVMGAVLEYNDASRVAPRAQYSLAQDLNNKPVSFLLRPAINTLNWFKDGVSGLFK